MNSFQTIILGVLQGLTEFLPVSSSGHLTLVEHLLGLSEAPLLFDILLHLASLIAVILFFHKRIFRLLSSLWRPEMKEERGEIISVIGATFVTAAFLFITKPGTYFIKANPLFLTITFSITAVILFFADRSLKKQDLNTKRRILFIDGLFIGFFQAFAVFPGISRSGSTISAALFRKISAEKAFEFSFILSIPAIAGAVILESLKSSYSLIPILPAILGMTSSFIASIVSLFLLSYLIRKRRMIAFAFYLIIPIVITLFAFFPH